MLLIPKSLKKFLWEKYSNKEVNKSEIINVIYLYRYVSLILTSLYYIIAGPIGTIFYKTVVILSLAVTAKIITDLYVKYKSKLRTLKIIILFETFSITLLLIPTGGLESPFIWYALNPVLVAANFLPPYFCWLNLFFYLTSSSIVSFTLFNLGKDSLAALIHKEGYLILVFILITLMAQLFAILMKKIEKANKLTQESMEQIMSLYHVVETFSYYNNLSLLFNNLVQYTKKLTKSTYAFYLLVKKNKNEPIFIESTKYLKQEVEEKLLLELENYLINKKEIKKSQQIRIQNNSFFFLPIKSNSGFYGFVGIEMSDYSSDVFKQLVFLSELSSIILERFQLEEETDKLIIIEEQNRIANEIHDSVSQRLFSIVCAMHALNKKWEKMEVREIKEKLNLISDSAAKAIQELRSSIYCLSSKKRGEKPFCSGLENYLKSLAKLNDIDINFVFTGDEDLIPGSLKKAIYRIICESTGNAVRHGKSRNVFIYVIINTENLKLEIYDDGKGFNIKKINENKSGLGITNMKNLVNSFDGKFTINSDTEKGTKIIITFPVENLSKQKERGVV